MQFDDLSQRNFASSPSPRAEKKSGLNLSFPAHEFAVFTDPSHCCSLTSFSDGFSNICLGPRTILRCVAPSPHCLEKTMRNLFCCCCSCCCCCSFMKISWQVETRRTFLIYYYTLKRKAKKKS
ncbi:unnamed protein product [Ixodes pacificus]